MAKIVIVEDDGKIRESYAAKLRSAGHEVTEAGNGEQGFDLIYQQKPNLVLLDLIMPIMDGKTMLQKLRDQEWGNEIPVIILTNISKDEAPVELTFLRVDGYVIKVNTNPDQVLALVNETLKINQKPAE